MLQQDKSEDFTISTGEQHTVREFVEVAAKVIDMDIEWQGKAIHETGNWQGKAVVSVDPRYFRPTEVETLLGDSTKAREELGWVPKISFKEMVSEMVTSDLNDAKRGRLCNKEGFLTYNFQE